jgi:hypothetical protein
MCPTESAAVAILLVIFAVFILPGCCVSVNGGGGMKKEYRETIEETVDASGLDEISVKSSNGAIEIEFARTNKVNIEAEKVVKSSTREKAEQYAREVEVVIVAKGSRLEIETKYHKRPGKSFQAGVSFTIKAPVGMDIRAVSSNGAIEVGPGAASAYLNTSDGSIRVEGVGDREPGDLIASTSNGAVTVIDCCGPSDISTSNGRITYSTSIAPQGDIELSTSNGAIKIEIPEDSDLTITAGTSNGSISASLPLEDVRKKKTSLKARMNRGTYDLDAGTSNGSINLSSY